MRLIQVIIIFDKSKADIELEYEVLKDFKKVANGVISEYDGRLPKDIIELWNEYGFGSFLNGYLKVINPHDYDDIVKESYFDADKGIPVMVTGLGDVITYEEGYMVGIFYRYSDSSVLKKGTELFFRDLMDEWYVNNKIKNQQYTKAVVKYGLLEYDECFGYVPLLGMGGKERVENLQKVKIKEHIELITQMVGRIE